MQDISEIYLLKIPKLLLIISYLQYKQCVKARVFYTRDRRPKKVVEFCGVRVFCRINKNKNILHILWNLQNVVYLKGQT